MNSTTRIKEFITRNFPNWEKMSSTQFTGADFNNDYTEIYKIENDEFICISYTNISITGSDRQKPQLRVSLEEYKKPFAFAKKNQFRYFLFSIFTKEEEMARGLDKFNPGEFIISIETNLDTDNSRRDLRSIYDYANERIGTKKILKCSRSNYRADINTATFIYVGNGSNETKEYFDEFVSIFDSRPYLNSSSDNGNITSIDLSYPDFPLQVIYYGAPGTGKSYKIKSLDKGKATKPVRTTFHPDSDYSTFVGAYKPSMLQSEEQLYTKEALISELTKLKELGVTYATQKFGAKFWYSLKQLTLAEKKDILSACGLSDTYTVEFDKGCAIGEDFLRVSKESRIVYQFTPQAFLKAYVQAWEHYPEPQYLVIEEINRGNCAQIFGDLFQLLDRSSTGFSEYPIAADSDLSKYLHEIFVQQGRFTLSSEDRDEINKQYQEEYADVILDVQQGELLLLPKNLYILATMNTSDQSLFPIDSAFKRRWEWEYIPIRNAGKGWVIKTNNNEWDWWTFLECINKKIGSVTDSEDKKLGYFFVKPQDEHTITAETFVSKVIFYLWNDVFKDYGFNDDEFQTTDGAEMTFPMFYETECADHRVNESLVAQFLRNVVGEPKQSHTDEQPTDETSES